MQAMAVDIKASASCSVSGRQALPWCSQRDGDVLRREPHVFDTIISDEKPMDLHAVPIATCYTRRGAKVEKIDSLILGYGT